MSSTISSRQQAPSRTWWSLSSKSPNIASGKPYAADKSSRQGSPKSSGLNFNSIASAIGFKPKKHPTLAIQSPPIQTITPASDGLHPTKPPRRPPSKSVSSAWSGVDSIEPRTPVDRQINTRQSLLTLSDIDPFARGGVSDTSDQNRLSGHSSSSMAGLGSKHIESSLYNRISYASSSSHSNIQHGSGLLPSRSKHSPTLTPDSPIQNLKAQRSVGSLNRKRSIRPPDVSLVSAWDDLTQAHQATITKSSSSSTLTGKNHSEFNPRPSPTIRPRGMTDSRTSQPSVFFPSERTHPHNPSALNPLISGPPTTSPRVIVRQASMSRVGLPPSAPPRHELPLPPLVSDDARDDDPEASLDVSAGSGSSSSLSFASSVSSNKGSFLSQPYSPRLKEKRSSERMSLLSSKIETEHAGHTFSKGSHSPLTTPRSLKKALSHQSLVKRGSPSSSPAHTSSTPPAERRMEKEPRKQRSFHQPKGSKFSIPPVRHTNSFGSQSPAPVGDSTPPAEQRRGSATPPSGRKRLFSGSNSRRPSTAQYFPSEDDTLSVFSLRSEQEHASPFVKPVSPTTSFSFWDEATHDQVPDMHRPATHEYTPQQIMSPAEMAQVEASVEESSVHGRTRGLSILSTSSVTSDGDESVLSGPSSPATWHGGMSTGLPLRSNSLLLQGLTVPRRLNVRPSTSDAYTGISRTHPSSLQSSSPPPQSMTSLPPPPRTRLRPSIATQAVSPEDGFGAGPPSLPVRRSLRAKVSVEKTFHRRSIMKKPSFLEIDDDTDKETDWESMGEPPNGSFLDLARESFDTVRSVSD